jgi:hypothetical protein
MLPHGNHIVVYAQQDFGFFDIPERVIIPVPVAYLSFGMLRQGQGLPGWANPGIQQ